MGFGRITYMKSYESKRMEAEQFWFLDELQIWAFMKKEEKRWVFRTPGENERADK